MFHQCVGFERNRFERSSLFLLFELLPIILGGASSITQQTLSLIVLTFSLIVFKDDLHFFTLLCSFFSS